ncbi:MAG: carboxypeptidase regulatory-like domain-containing protein [Pirellulales bacterium]|nr:carboxypeptidase regulatory-like domain-containing protein [Pirellulales bacterium]
MKTSDDREHSFSDKAARRWYSAGQSQVVMLLATVTFFLLLLPGCGKSRPKPVEVTGKVTYRGKPVEEATVNFFPESGYMAIATTDTEGRFTLKTSQVGDGAVVGKYEVTVVKYRANPRANAQTPPNEQHLPVLPMRYADRKTSKLTANVMAEGPNDFTFDLVD